MHVTKYFQKRHQIAKVELISKEILKRNLAKKGLQAQLETCHSPDDAVSSVKHQTIGLPPRGCCRKVWSYRKKILTNQGVLHGVIPQCRTSSAAAVSCRRISDGVPRRRERFLAVLVLPGGRSTGISRFVAVVDHARGQSQGHQMLVSGDAGKPFPPHRDAAAPGCRVADAEACGRAAPAKRVNR